MPRRSETDYDVVVAGAGIAGLCAAVEASATGASVLVVEGQSQIGGSSSLSGGIIMAADTSVQRRTGIVDSAEALFRDYLLFTQHSVQPGIARQLACGSGPAVEWLCQMGIEFHDELVFAAEEPVPRSHVTKRGGRGIVKTLAAELDKSSAVDVALGQRIDRLLCSDGEVRGVAVDDDEVRAGSVVITMGGFGANRSLWPAHLPDVSRTGAAVWYIGSQGAQGDFFRLGAQVDAGIAGEGRALTLATPGFSTRLEIYFPGWLVMVDRTGARRVDESTSYAVMELAHRRHGPLFAVFDDAARQAASPELAPRYKQTIPGMPLTGVESNWTTPVIDEMVAAGRITRSSSLEDLGRAIGVDASGLCATIARYNDGARHGRDTEFLKDPKFLEPVGTPPYYGCVLELGILALTSAGLSIDPDARVLNRSGEPISGLFAAGESAGGVLGDVYVGSGNSIAACLVFGRIAGRQAAQRRIA
jgi:fumarate reductase flavoprotein subunit